MTCPSCGLDIEVSLAAQWVTCGICSWAGSPETEPIAIDDEDDLEEA